MAPYILSMYVNVTLIVSLLSCGTQSVNTEPVNGIAPTSDVGHNQKLEMLPTVGIEFAPEIYGTYWYQGPSTEWDSLIWSKECRQITTLQVRDEEPEYFVLTWDGLTEHSSKHCISIRKMQDSTYRIVHVLAPQLGTYDIKDVDSTDFQFLGMGMVLERFYQQPGREDMLIDVKYESAFDRKDCSQGNY